MAVRPQESPVRVEVHGLPDECVRALERALERRLPGGGARVAEGGAPDAADVVVTGPGVDGAEAARRIAAAGAAALESGRPAPAAIALAAGSDLGPFEPLVAADRLYFVAPGLPEADAVADLVVAAAREGAAGPPDREATAGLLALERELAAAGRPGEVAARLGAALPRLVPEISVVRCLRYDRASGTLVEEAGSDGPRTRHSAASGLLAWVARTGRRLDVERPERDPRYDPDLDGAAGRGLSALPLTGAGGRVLAVLAVVHDRPLPPMGERRLEAAAGRAAHALDRLDLEATFAAATRGSPVFRPAALEAQARGTEGDGALLELGPGWIRWTYRLLVALLIAAGLYLALGTRTEYVSGPAVVRLDGAGERPRVVGFLPGHARPRLRDGMPLRLRLDGYPQAAAELVAGPIPDSIVGAEEALGRLPRGLAESLRPTGPTLVVEAELPAGRFVAAGERYEYFDGMTGTLEAAVRRERLLFALMPGLRSLDRPVAEGET